MGKVARAGKVASQPPSKAVAALCCYCFFLEQRWWIMSELNSDTKADTARALHRVVRAMHDGNCPKCGNIDFDSKFKHCGDDGRIDYWQCRICKFMVTREEAEAALELFRPYMQANLAEFVKWRLNRITQPGKHWATVTMHGHTRQCLVTAVGPVSAVYNESDVVVVKSDGSLNSGLPDKLEFCYLEIQDWNDSGRYTHAT